MLFNKNVRVKACFIKFTFNRKMFEMKFIVFEEVDPMNTVFQYLSFRKMFLRSL